MNREALEAAMDTTRSATPRADALYRLLNAELRRLWIGHRDRLRAQGVRNVPGATELEPEMGRVAFYVYWHEQKRKDITEAEDREIRAQFNLPAPDAMTEARAEVASPGFGLTADGARAARAARGRR